MLSRFSVVVCHKWHNLCFQSLKAIDLCSYMGILGHLPTDEHLCSFSIITTLNKVSISVVVLMPVQCIDINFLFIFPVIKVLICITVLLLFFWSFHTIIYNNYAGLPSYQMYKVSFTWTSFRHLFYLFNIV